MRWELNEVKSAVGMVPLWILAQAYSLQTPWLGRGAEAATTSTFCIPPGLLSAQVNASWSNSWRGEQ